ncbi:hypothetical protein PCE1_000751 [Barthelona sp. PCE]
MEKPEFRHNLNCEDHFVTSFNSGRYNICVDHICSSRSISYDLLLAIASHEYGAIFLHNILETGIRSVKPNSLTLNQWKKLLNTYVDMKDAHPGPYYIEYFGEEEEHEGEEPLYQRLYFQFYNRLDEHEKSIFDVFPVFFIAYKLGFQFKQGSTDEVIDFWWDFHSLGSTILPEYIHTFFNDFNVDWKSDFHSCWEETVYMMFKRFYRNGKVALPMLKPHYVNLSVEKYPGILDCLSQRNVTVRYGEIPLDILFMKIPSLSPKIDGRRIFMHYMNRGTYLEKIYTFRNFFSQPIEITKPIVDDIFRESLTFMEDHYATPSPLIEVATKYFLTLPNIEELLSVSQYLDIFYDTYYMTFDQEREKFAIFAIMWCWLHCMNITDTSYLYSYRSDQMNAFGFEVNDWNADADDYVVMYKHYNEELVEDLQKIVMQRSNETSLIQFWAQLFDYTSLSTLKNKIGEDNEFFNVFCRAPYYWENINYDHFEQREVYDGGRPVHRHHGRDADLDLISMFEFIKPHLRTHNRTQIELPRLRMFINSFLRDYNNPGTHTMLSPEEYPHLGIDNLPLSVHWARAYVESRSENREDTFNGLYPRLRRKVDSTIEKRYLNPIVIYPSETPGFKTIAERTLENPQWVKIGRYEYPFINANCGVLVGLDWDDARFLRSIEELIPILNSGKYDDSQLYKFAYYIRALIAWSSKDWYFGVQNLLRRITEHRASEMLDKLYFESLTHFHNFPRSMTERGREWTIVNLIDQLFGINRF